MNADKHRFFQTKKRVIASRFGEAISGLVRRLLRAGKTPVLAMTESLFIASIATLTACNLPQNQPLTPTSQPSPTLTLAETPTINWFPPTFTSTPFNTPLPATATPAPPPPVGSLIYQDDFTHPGLWLTGQFNVGTIAYGNSELSLAISQPRGVLLSTRPEPVLGDFYLEVTAIPSLCLTSDAYGIQFRMASSNSFYRFSVSCNGQVRLERLKDGAGQVLHDWSASAQAFPNATGTYKLGVWAVGSDLRLYIDDILQFSVSDASLSTGGLGLYARSMGDTAVTVSFTNLAVYQASSQTFK